MRRLVGAAGRGALAALIAAAVLAPPALAGESRATRAADEWARTGFVFRGGAALAFENSAALSMLNARLPALIDSANIPGLPSGATVDLARFDVDAGLGVSLGVGYRLHPHFGVETSFDWSRADVDFDLALTLPLLGGQSVTEQVGTVTLWTVTADFSAYLTTGRVQPFATIGIGVMREGLSVVPNRVLSSSERTGLVPRFGGGVELWLTRHVGVDVDAGYLLGTGELDERDAITVRVGLLGRF